MLHVVRKEGAGEYVGGRVFTISEAEIFWLEVIREASRDSDPAPTLERIRRVRAIFREPG